EKARRCEMAMGCSTNSVRHLTAVAYEMGVPDDMELIDKISKKTPQIAKLKPADKIFIADLDKMSGIPANMKERSKKNIIHTDCITVSGTVGDRIKNSEGADGEIIKTLENPVRPDGGIAVLKGNIAKEGAVVKQGAVAPEMMFHTGPARCFDSEEE